MQAITQDQTQQLLAAKKRQVQRRGSSHSANMQKHRKSGPVIVQRERGIDVPEREDPVRAAQQLFGEKTAGTEDNDQPQQMVRGFLDGVPFRRMARGKLLNVMGHARRIARSIDQLMQCICA